MRTGPSSSTRITSGRSYFMGSYSLSDARSAGRQVENACRDDVLLDLRGATHHALGPAVEVRLERDVVAVDRAGRSREVESRGADGLLDPRHEQLVDRAAGPM